MNDMQKQLVEIDTLLATINVSKDDVFLMADARRRLKSIFDTINKLTEGKEEEAKNGG